MHEELMEQVVTQENATAAWLAVKRNGGAPGIDGMTTQQLRDHVRKHWETIRAKLLSGTYVPSPVRRVEIPKPNGGVRLLGIPTVLDRWIQQMLLQALQPILDPTFSAQSFGFRPGKSAQDAVRAAQNYIQAGKDWVVDMDITKFFDRVNHDILMQRIGQTIRDKRVLRLMGKYLRAGVMIEGVVQSSEEGTPQGGPLSPLLANIYLDALDRELEGRGLAFSRYADDGNIYVSSQRAAERVLASITEWIKKHLRLEVNAGNGSSWAFVSTRKGRSKQRLRVWSDSKRKSGSYGEAVRVKPVLNCGTAGALTSEAGGDISVWPRNAGTSSDWRAGYGDTFGVAFGSGGTTGGDDCASCGAWA